MSTDKKTIDKLKYTENVLNMTDPRFLSEAENHRFTKRRSPVTTWLAAACFALIFGAAILLLLKPMGERPIHITQPTEEPTTQPSASPKKTLVFSAGNEFPDYGAEVLKEYDAAVLEYPNGNPHFTGDERKPLGAKLLLPKGWTVSDGMFDGLGYYPIEEFVSYSTAARLGNEVKSIYNEKGECVGTIGLAATSKEYPDYSQAFAAIMMGNGAFILIDDGYYFLDDAALVKVDSGKNGEAYAGRVHYVQKLAEPAERLELELPALISYDSEFLVGIVVEFAENAVSYEQLSKIAESVRFGVMMDDEQLESPTALPTAGPTAEPTAPPTEQPFPYNREEYDTLLAFFELKDENGVKNGEKVFDDYDPATVNFWGDNGDDPAPARLEWNEEGDLTLIWFGGSADKSAELVGELKLNGFESLEYVHSSAYITLESVEIKDCPNLKNIGITGREETDIVCAPIDYVVDSRNHLRFESTGQDNGNSKYTVDLTVKGSGAVINMKGPEEHWPKICIYAEADEGYRFAGWYDADGNMFSANSYVKISTDSEELLVGDFIYTARFVPTFTVTRDMLAEAGYGYVHDGTGMDAVTIGRFLANRHAALLTDCPDNNPEHCIEAEFIDEVNLMDGDMAYEYYPDGIQQFSYLLRVRPSDLNAFMSYHSCDEYADRDGDGWITLEFEYFLCSTETDGVWVCDLLAMYASD